MKMERTVSLAEEREAQVHLFRLVTYHSELLVCFYLHLVQAILVITNTCLTEYMCTQVWLYLGGDEKKQ